MDISVIDYDDYKKFLRAYISHLKPNRGLISRLAAAAQCQPSYLSQVLGSHVQITPVQALAIAEYLNFSVLELEYFTLLVDLARSSSQRLQKRIHLRLASIKTQNEDLASRLERPKVNLTLEQALYYSSWLWSALHVLVDIPEFQTTNAIASKLNIGTETLIPYLEQLEKLGFIKRELGHWKHSGAEIHLSKDSPLISMHHNNWRQLAVLKSQQKNEDNLHFTGVYAVSTEDFERLKEMILKNLSAMAKLASASKSEKLICINYDLFEA